MKRLLIVLAASCCVLWAAPTGAVTLVTPDGQVAQPYQRWADASLVPTPPVTVTLVRAACPASPAKSCAQPPATIYLRPSDPAVPRRFAHAFAHEALLHELGHVFDYTVMTDSARRAFGRIIGDRRAWRLSMPPASVHEKFAEAYRLCAQFERLPRFDVAVGYFAPGELTRGRFARACALIRHVGGWYMSPTYTSPTF